MNFQKFTLCHFSEMNCIDVYFENKIHQYFEGLVDVHVRDVWMILIFRKNVTECVGNGIGLIVMISKRKRLATLILNQILKTNVFNLVFHIVILFRDHTMIQSRQNPGKVTKCDFLKIHIGGHF